MPKIHNLLRKHWKYVKACPSTKYRMTEGFKSGQLIKEKRILIKHIGSSIFLAVLDHIFTGLLKI